MAILSMVEPSKQNTASAFFRQPDTTGSFCTQGKEEKTSEKSNLNPGEIVIVRRRFEACSGYHPLGSTRAIWAGSPAKLPVKCSVRRPRLSRSQEGSTDQNQVFAEGTRRGEEAGGLDKNLDLDLGIDVDSNPCQWDESK